MSDDLSHETTVSLPQPADVFEMFVPHKSMTSRGVHYFTVVHPEARLRWVVSEYGRLQPGTRSRW
eukprot:11250472-Prorocentrum_lima.AAC.1